MGITISTNQLKVAALTTASAAVGYWVGGGHSHLSSAKQIRSQDQDNVHAMGMAAGATMALGMSIWAVGMVKYKPAAQYAGGALAGSALLGVFPITSKMYTDG